MKKLIRGTVLAATAWLTVSCHDSSAPPPATEAASAGAAVATLKWPVADVKVRPTRELIWKQASDGMPLADHDAIKTGAASSATVIFTDASSLKVSESTLMIVMGHSTQTNAGKPTEAGVVALPLGGIDSQLKRPADRDVELVVRTTRGWVHASTRSPSGAGAAMEPKFHVAITPRGDLQVKSETGEVAVTAQGREEIVHAREKLEVPAPPGAPAPSADLGAAGDAAFAELPKVAPATAWVKAPLTAADVEPAAAKVAAPRRSPIQKDAFAVASPKNGSVTHAEMIGVKGTLGGRLKAFLNGEEVKASADGTFSIELPLQLGTNVLTFQIIGPGAEDVRYETVEVVRK